MTVFVISVCAVVFFWSELILSIQSPEFKRDVARFREQKRIRKAARR